MERDAINSGRWPRIEELFHRAAELVPAQRAGFLENACGGDADLRHEVESLLAHDASGQGVLGTAVRPPVVNVMTGMEGRELRGYRLIREIGQGGMGSVYLAERVDGAYHKQVAVKLIRPGRDSAEIIGRFQREREILASLDHPNIARLFDGGSTEEALPYFVMEFVEGRPIHRWCNEHKLSVSERVALFRVVCATVHYAHQHLVVHCDLKPSNIFVAEDGTVKLLDFGISKLLKPKNTDDPEATVTLLKAMTPEYASPEQVRGEPISTLTDVYSLGVVLYELLTGRRPYHLVSGALHEITRAVLEEEPTRPSDAVLTPESPSQGDERVMAITSEAIPDLPEGDPDRLRKRLRGDLDSILLTALRKEPARRYSSAEAFGDDLRRHLEHRPVSAREDSLGYRINRYLHRHPGGVTATVAIVVFLAAALLTMLWEMRIALDAGHRSVAAHTILAPQMTMFLFFDLAGLVGVAYLTRARLLRVLGALAAATGTAAVRMAGLRLDISMGWWQSRFAESPNPLSVVSEPALFLMYVSGFAMLFLICWRLIRRFGWAGRVVPFVAVAIGAPLRERIWFDKFMQVMFVPLAALPMAADAVVFAAGLMLGFAVMRFLAGPARRDRLARTQ